MVQDLKPKTGGSNQPSDIVCNLNGEGESGCKSKDNRQIKMHTGLMELGITLVVCRSDSVKRSAVVYSEKLTHLYMK